MDLARLKIDRGERATASPAPPPVRRARGRFPWGIAVLVGLVGLAAYAFRAPLEEALDRVRLPVVRVAVVEETHPAERGAVAGLAANGYVVAARRAALSADTPGRIVEMLVTEGSVVAEGQVVARLFDEELRAALARAEADLAVTEASVARATAQERGAAADVRQVEATFGAAIEARHGDEAELGLARRERERAERLAQTGVSTGRELDETDARLARANAALKRSRALEHAAEEAVGVARARVGVAAAEVSVAAAQRDAAAATRDQAAATLRKTEVRAPFAGIVVLKDAEVGEVVSPNVQGGSNARGSVVTLVDFASLEVQCDVPETSIAQIRAGQRATVFLDAWPDQPYEGRVDRLWPTANRQKATVEVRVALTAPDTRLRPEMGARVVFAPNAVAGAAGAAAASAAAGTAAGSPDAGAVGAPDAAAGGAASGTAAGSSGADAAGTARAAGEADAASPTAGGPPLVIPAEARVRVQGEAGVFVVEQGVVRFVAVRFGPARGGRVIVEAGLEPGEAVVLDPPTRMATGDRVRVEGKP